MLRLTLCALSAFTLFAGVAAAANTVNFAGCEWNIPAHFIQTSQRPSYMTFVARAEEGVYKLVTFYKEKEYSRYVFESEIARNVVVLEDPPYTLYAYDLPDEFSDEIFKMVDVVSGNQYVTSMNFSYDDFSSWVRSCIDIGIVKSFYKNP